MFDSKFNHEARFFADGYELSGIENVSFSYNATPNIIKPLGTKDGLTTHSGPIQQTMSLSRVLTYNDPVFSYTGEGSLSGRIYYEDDYSYFNSGYLTDYSMNCAVGSVPRVSCNFQIADEIKKFDNQTSEDAPLPELKEHPPIDIPTQGSILIECDNFQTNRVVGFDYGIKCGRKAYLSVGSNDIKNIELLPPIEFNATVQIEVDDAFLQNSHKFLEEKENKKVSIAINGRDGFSVNFLQIPNASLVSENLQVSADGSAKLTLNYIGHSAKPEGSALSSDVTYVFDENGDVYDSTGVSILPYEWHREDDDVYGLQVGDFVKKIDGRSFFGCTNLRGDLYINMDSGVAPDFSIIEYAAFKNCSGFDGSLIIEDGLQKIGYGAFKESTLKGNLIFPDSIIEFQGEAFDGCSNFKGILKLPDSELTINKFAFRGCNGLKGDLTIPDGLSGGVREGTFKDCSGFDGNLYLGTGIEILEKNAFFNCSNLKGNLTMPPNLTGIRGSVFYNCNELDGVLTLNSGLKYIGTSAFAQCHQISNGLVIPDSVNGIDDYAFNSCRNIQSLTIGTGLNYIGTRAFEGCDSLAGDIDFKNVTAIRTRAFNETNIGGVSFDEIIYIDSGAFKDCVAINGDIILPDSLIDLAPESFMGCSNLDGDLVIGDGLTQLRHSVFKDTSFNGGLTLGQNITSIELNAFHNAGFTNQLVLPDSLNAIKFNAFAGCNFTGDLVLHSGISQIRPRSFQYNRNIKRVIVDFPPTVFADGSPHFTEVGQDVGGGALYATERDYYDYINHFSTLDNGLFYGIPVERGALQSRVYNASDDSIVVFEDGDIQESWYDSTESSNNGSPNVYIDIGFNVNEIGLGAFQNNQELNGNIFIPGNVTKIGPEAFQNCPNVSGELFLNEGLIKIDERAFEDSYSIKGDLKIPNSVTGLDNFSFQRCSGFDGELYLSTGLTYLGYYCFRDMYNLSGSIDIPANITGIGNGSFQRCSGFSSLNLNDNLEVIKNSAFAFCKNISNNIIIPNSTKQIGNYSFRACESVPSFDLGNNVETLGDSAFEECISIDSIVIKNNVTSIGNNCFRDCSGVQYAYIDVPTGAIGNHNSLRFVDDGATSDRILFVSEQYYNDYLTASTTDLSENQGVGTVQGYFQGNLISIWSEDERSSIYYDSSFNVVDSVLGDVPESWKEDDTNGSYLYIGNKTNTIGEGAFRNANEDVSNLSGTILLPSTLNEVGAGAFVRTRISSVASQEGFKEIQSQAFLECQSIKTVVLPASLEFVGQKAFYKNDELQRLKIGNNETRVRKTILDTEAFRVCGATSAKQGVIDLGYTVDRIGPSCFANDAGAGGDWIETLNSSAREYGISSFRNQYNLTNLNLTKDALTIGQNAFELCLGLTNVVLPDPNNVYDRAFRFCNNITGIEIGSEEGAIDGNLWTNSFRDIGTDATNGTLKINKSIANVDNSAFYGDTNRRWIQSANLDCRTIGADAFRYQSNMTDLTFGPNVKYIGVGNTDATATSFQECLGLTGVRIPDPYYIRYYSFNYCTGITGVYIGNDDKDSKGIIGDSSFRRIGPPDNNLVRPRVDGHVYVGSSIDKIEQYAFYATNNSENYRYSWIGSAELNCRVIDKQAFYRQRNIKELTFGSGVKVIGRSVSVGESFYYNEKLKEIKIPDPENIWYYSFANCTGITGVSIGNDEKNTQGRIEADAFRRIGPPVPAVGVIDLYVGSSIDLIGVSAFNANNDGDADKYSTIKKATINARHIDVSAFYNQKNITGITFGDTVKVIGVAGNESSQTFYGNYELKEIKITDPEAIYGRAFQYCTGTTGVYIGNNEKNTQGKIHNQAFRNVGTNTTNGRLYVGSSIKDIGYESFRADGTWKWIQSADLNCETIGYAAFADHSNITELTFGSGVKNIGVGPATNQSQTFYQCYGLTGVRIPDPENIWYRSFNECSSITGVYIGNNTESTDGYVGADAFRVLGTAAQGSAGNGHAYVGSSIKKLDSAAFYGDRYWLYSADINCEEIGYQCFEQQRNLKELTLSSGVKTIGGRAFYDNYALTGIRIPDPTFIEEYAFQYTYGITGTVHVGNDTEDTQGLINNFGFRYMGPANAAVGTIDLYVGSSIESIGSNAFDAWLNSSNPGYFRNIKSADLNCKTIGYQAFYNQDNLTGVTLSSGVKNIGVPGSESRTFEECGALTELRIPDPKHVGPYAAISAPNITGLYIGNNTEDTQGVVDNDGGRYIGASQIGQGYLSIGSSIRMIGTGAFHGDYQWLKKADLNCEIIGVRAFYNQDNLTGVTLSSGVKQVWFEAFQECDGLTGLKIPDPNFVGAEIFENARNITGLYIGNDTENTKGRIKTDCGRYMSSSKINQGYLYLGSSIEEVESQAFYGDYDWITGAVINAKNIRSKAFYSQNNLREVNFGDNVKRIDLQAFQECNNLRKVVVTNPIKIGDLAFDNIDGLTGVYIGNQEKYNVGRIQSQAFNYCGQGTDGQGHVYVGKSIEYVSSDRAFKAHYANSKWIKSIDINCETLGDNSGSNYVVGYGTFHNQGNLTDVSISSGVKNIGVQTFDTCTGITGLRIPDPENIYLNACHLCKNITGLYVGNDEKDPYATLKDQSFHQVGESKLGQGHIYLGKSIKYVGFSAVGGYYNGYASNSNYPSWSTSVQEYEVGDEVLYNNVGYRCIESHDPQPFGGVFDVDFFIRYPDRNPGLWQVIQTVVNVGYYGYPWLKTADLKCKEFGERAFLHQDNLTGITFSKDCKIFGYRSFDHCVKNIEVKIPGSRENDVYIGELAFNRNYDIEEVQIGVSQGFDGNSVIERDAFRNCGQNKLGLGYVYIHRSVRTVKEKAFYGDHNWIKKAIINCYSVASGSFAEQQNLDDLFFTNGVREVSGYAFENCTALTGSIRFKSNKVNNVEENAFAGCPVGDIYFDTEQSSVNTGAFPDMQANAKFYVTQGKIGTWGPTFNGHQVVEWTTYPNTV